MMTEGVTHIAGRFNGSVSVSSEDENLESRVFYYGLPSKPISVFRTGAPWQKPTGFEAYLVPKVIRPVFDDGLAAIWEEMGTQIYNYLDAVDVNWTTIDVVRFAEPVKYSTVRETVGPVVLWIGVHPGSLPPELAQEAVCACQNILQSFDIDGVEIAFRESLFRRYSRKLLDYIPSDNPISSFCGPLTAALGLPIASVQYTGSEGTGGIYLSAGNDIYLLTARHVVLPPEEVDNILYDQKQSSQDVQVRLPSPAAFDSMVQSISDKINTLNRMKTKYEKQLIELQRNEIGNTDSAEKKRAKIESNLKEEETTIETLEDFQSDVINDWSQGKDFIIGRVVYAPPINANEGPKRNSEDWALIELDRSKINWTKFRGNVIDLGTEMTMDKFLSLMYPYKSMYPMYPYDRLIPIQCVVPEDELTHPKNKDAKGEPYNKLIKNGGRTKTTIGCGNGIKSFVREQWNGTKQTSLEFAILAQEMRSAFSGRGDSGSVIVDSEGRAAALLIGGCGYNESADITYGTPFEWLLKRIKVQFPDVQLYQASNKI
ncbi:hypothetical protein BDQ17DRAFT_1332153 [Cyathus striatus]|nr:hypothetical protein BDQ17DRAFT_1332153 [Cyathus striatus]